MTLLAKPAEQGLKDAKDKADKVVDEGGDKVTVAQLLNTANMDAQAAAQSN